MRLLIALTEVERAEIFYNRLKAVRPVLFGAAARSFIIPYSEDTLQPAAPGANDIIKKSIQGWVK